MRALTVVSSRIVPDTVTCELFVTVLFSGDVIVMRGGVVSVAIIRMMMNEFGLLVSRTSSVLVELSVIGLIQYPTCWLKSDCLSTSTPLGFTVPLETRLSPLTLPLMTYNV